MRSFNLKYKPEYSKLSDYKQDYKWGNITRDFKCPNFNLTSLEGAPRIVRGNFTVLHNSKLFSLKGGPLEATSYNCYDNNLTSLEGAPHKAIILFDATNNKIADLKGIGRSYLTHCEQLDLSENPIKSHILGLILVKDLEILEIDDIFSNSKMLNTFLKFNKTEEVLEAQEWLISNGLRDYAKL